MDFSSRILALTTLAGALAAAVPAYAADPAACSLLTQAQATAIYGGAVMPGIENAVAGLDSCVFQAEDNDHSVSLTLMTFPSADVAQIMYATASKPQPGTASTPVGGLGDTAVYNASATEGSVWVMYHGKLVAVDGNNTSNSNLKAAILQAAQQILGKL